MNSNMSSFTIPVPLFADAGIPMIGFAWPLMLILLIPIIVVEGFLCKKWLGLTTWEAMKSNACSNLLSTVIGIPLAWAVMLAVEIGTSGLASRSSTIQNWHSPLANAVFVLFGLGLARPRGRQGCLDNPSCNPGPYLFHFSSRPTGSNISFCISWWECLMEARRT